MNAAHSPDWIDEYRALVEAATVVELERTQIELNGADRAKFLHNLSTNEIRKLAVGEGCEAFLTSVQGKTLAHVFAFVCPESIVLDTVAGQGEAILKHLDHYLVSEQVTLADRSGEWGELLVAGPKAAAVLERAGQAAPPEVLLAHREVEIAGQRAWARRVEMTPSGGFLISTRRESIAAVRDALLAAGAAPCGLAAFDAARIEQGFPLFGRDISADNLPQEVARDARAISFVKGCYLGQETVARIDALGHVNKQLVGLRFAGAEVPEPGVELTSDDKVAGHVTSAAYSPKFSAAIALGYLRAASAAAGTQVTSSCGAATVVALPMAG